MNTTLEITDIINTPHSHPEIPAHINDVIFDVKEHIESILDDVLQKFRITQTPGSEKTYSLADIRNFHDISIHDLKELFIRNFQINLDNPDSYNKINQYFQESIKIIENRYGREVGTQIKHHVISSAEDIKKILDTTGKGHKGVMFCAISKLFLSLSTLNKDPRVTEIDKIHSEITRKIISPFSNLQEKTPGFETGEIYIDQEEKTIPINFFHRSKSKESIVGKQMGNIEYNKVDDYKDLHGYTIEFATNNPNDIIFTLEKYYYMLLSEAKHKKTDDCDVTVPDIKIENKNMISLEDLENIKKDLSEEFYLFLKENLIRSENSSKKKQKEKGTSDTYRDIKILLDFKTNNPKAKHLAHIYSGTEIKFTLQGNQNEHGLAFHGIFDYKKRFREMTRIFGFIHHEDVLFFVNDLFAKINEKLLKQSKDFPQYMQELIEDINKKHSFFPQDFKYIPHDLQNLLEIKKGFYYDLLQEITEVKISSTSKHSFFVHKSYFDLVPEINKELVKIEKK